MQRGAFFCLWILFTFSLFAQNKENGSVACDSIVYKNTFRKALKKFLNFSDFDTTYISPNRYNYALMLDHFTNYEYYSVGNDDQRLRFSPNPHNKIGAYFGWRWIFLGWAVDTDWLYGKKSKKKRGTEFDLSLYSSKLGVDIFYRSTGNDYKIHKVSGFSDEIPSNYSEDFNGLSASVANPSASFTAISASIFLFISMLATFKPCMNLLYDSPFILAAALIRAIQS